jgi:hypothetical protein
VRNEGYSLLAALGLHVVVVLVARAMPPLALLDSSNQQDLRVIDIELPTSLPPEVREPPPSPEPPGPTSERLPEGRAAARTVTPPVGPQVPSTAEPPPETNPAPSPTSAQRPSYDTLPGENKGVLGVEGVPGLGSPVWAMPGVLPQGTSAGAPAPTVAPAPRPVDSDIAGQVVRDQMAINDKKLGLDAPMAGSMASAVQGAVMDSNIPSGTRGSIVCNVSPSGVVSGCKLATSTGGGSEAWSAAMQAATAISGPLSGQYAHGAIVTIDVSVRDTPPAGSKGGFTGTGANFDLANIGAHATKKVSVSHHITPR